MEQKNFDYAMKFILIKFYNFILKQLQQQQQKNLLVYSKLNKLHLKIIIRYLKTRLTEPQTVFFKLKLSLCIMICVLNKFLQMTMNES